MRTKKSITSVLLLCVGISCLLPFYWHIGLSSHKSSPQHDNVGPLKTRNERLQRETSNFFSACLLVMDDNHYLVEWLAYHYHVLPLRHLVIAVDPRSETSPSFILDRWRNMGMTIWEWSDKDYITAESLHEAEERVYYQFGNLSSVLIRHRARQRLFYYNCMKKLKSEGLGWTVMIDTDEFLKINYKGPQQKNTSGHHLHPIGKPGSVQALLQEAIRNPDGYNITKSPCIQIPRLRFGAMEDPIMAVDKHNQPTLFNSQLFQTMRWRKHAQPDQYWLNKISKTMIDLSRMSWNQLVPVESLHRPVKSLCTQRGLHIRLHNSFFVINHYLGSWDQFNYRKDARNGQERNQQIYNKQNRGDFVNDDEIRPWLDGFSNLHGDQKATALLDGVGIMENNH